MKYSEDEKRAVKKFIMDKISKTLDDSLVHLESSYKYDPFRAEIWIDSFHGEFRLHFTPANEMNNGQNFYLHFHHFRGDK
jgi:hypothetical protein